jgi:hypothetical protein
MSSLLSGQGVLAAAFAALIVLSAALWIENRSLRQTPPEPRAGVYSFTLPPAGLGGGKRPRRILLPEDTPVVNIDLALDRLWPGGDYTATISSGGRTLWTQSAPLAAGATKITVLAPRHIFGTGQFEVTLARPAASAAPDAVKRYSFTVNVNPR